MLEIIKSLGWLGTVVGAIIAALWGYLSYEDRARIEFQKPMVTKTVDLCFEVSKLAGDLVSEPDTTKWESDRVRFWSLYYGELVLVEGGELASAMVNFGKQIAFMKSEDRTNIGSSALEISKACRKQVDTMMANKWKLDTTSLLETTQAIKVFPNHGANK